MLRWLSIGLFVLAIGTPRAEAQVHGRVVEAIDQSEHSDHIDISLIFGCGLRYLGHSPASSGNSVRIRLLPLEDCTDLSGPLSGPALDGASAIRSMDIDQPLAREVALTLYFAATERFVLAPTADSHGLRLRLLRATDSKARVLVGESVQAPAAYAVNLDSSEQPFGQSALDRASRLGGAPAYVSEYTLGEKTWYRLRIGPFASAADARKVLMAIRADYPKAWLAIGDDTTLNAPTGEAATLAAVPTLPRSTATLGAAERDTVFDQARQSFKHKDYGTAIPLLTRLLEQPEFPARAQAQELMGLARERNRQLAHAKAEYEEYLRRYPSGPAAGRIRERLRALALATRPGRSGGAGADEMRSAWKFYGGAAQIYRRDTSQLDNAALTSSFVSQNALLNDFDMVARRRGERFDFNSRFSAGYVKDFLPETGPGDQSRVTTAFVEIGDRQRDWSARLGRQSRNTAGLFGSFDGVSGGYRLSPHLRLGAAGGYPVETARDPIATQRQFAGLSLDIGTFASAWDFSAYAVNQQLAGRTDRQAIGTELRYFKPGRTLVALLDYDLHYQELNNAFVLGTLELPARWILNASWDRRKSPSLSLRNALIGQPVTSFDALLGLFTPDEIEQLARDRTADTDLYSLSVSRPFGDRWQWSLDVSNIALGATPASGGVDAVPDLGADRAVTLQGIASSLFGANTLTTLALRYQTGSTLKVDSLGLSTRFPLWGALHVGPRLRIDRREILTDGSEQWLYVPTLRLDLQRRLWLFEVETGAELGRRDLQGVRENSSRYYFSLGYRMNF